jgi:hypothetical protein
MALFVALVLAIPSIPLIFEQRESVWIECIKSKQARKGNKKSQRPKSNLTPTEDEVTVQRQLCTAEARHMAAPLLANAPTGLSFTDAVEGQRRQRPSGESLSLRSSLLSSSPPLLRSLAVAAWWKGLSPQRLRAAAAEKKAALSAALVRRSRFFTNDFAGRNGAAGCRRDGVGRRRPAFLYLRRQRGAFCAASHPTVWWCSREMKTRRAPH